MAQTIQLSVAESVETNDHEVLILIGGMDIFSGRYMGIDPPDFFSQENLLSGGEILVGRCECGCEGCDDLRCEVEITGGLAVWRTSDENMYELVLSQYLEEINRAASDYSWETPIRTAERLVSEIFSGKTLEGNYQFNWASGRIDSGEIVLSFNGGVDQKLYRFKWDGQDPMSAKYMALEKIKEFYFVE